MNFGKPTSLNNVVDAMLKILGLYGKCEKCVDTNRIEVLEDNLLSPQSYMGKIFCVEGVGERQGSDEYKKFEVEVNWLNPRNGPVTEENYEIKNIAKTVEELGSLV